MTFPSPFPRPVLLALAAAALLNPGLRAQADAPPALRDALVVQQARSSSGKSQDVHARFYTKQWDLSSLAPYVPEQAAHGTLRILGNDVFTRGLLLEYLKAGFRKFQPGVTIEFHLSTSAAAMPALLMGAADIGLGRHLMFMEQLGFQRVYGYDPLQIDALNGAFNKLGWNPAWVIVVNKHNPIDRITVRQLDGIFGAQRNGGWVGTTWHPEFTRGPEGNIRRWGQMGLGGQWKDLPIRVMSMPFQYDPSNTFCRLVIQGSDKWNETIEQYPQHARPDGTLAIGAEDLVKEIARDPSGIGWSQIGYLTPETKALAVAVSDAGPYIAPTLESVQDRSYYFHSTNYFYVNRRPGSPVDPKIKEFIRYVLSREGQEEVIRDGKILPLTGPVVLEQLKKLE